MAFDLDGDDLYLLSHSAWRRSVSWASEERVDWSSEKNMRSPTTVVNSPSEPGGEAPPAPLSRFGVFFFEQAASARKQQAAAANLKLALRDIMRNHSFSGPLSGSSSSQPGERGTNPCYGLKQQG